MARPARLVTAVQLPWLRTSRTRQLYLTIGLDICTNLISCPYFGDAPPVAAAPSVSQLHSKMNPEEMAIQSPFTLQENGKLVGVKVFVVIPLHNDLPCVHKQFLVFTEFTRKAALAVHYDAVESLPLRQTDASFNVYAFALAQSVIHNFEGRIASNTIQVQRLQCTVHSIDWLNHNVPISLTP